MKKTFTLFFITIWAISIFAQPGIIDSTFVIGTGFSNQTKALAKQADGKILIGGQFTSFNGTNFRHLVRLNYNGSIDSTFFIGSTGFTGGNINTIVVLPDSNILVAGGFTFLNSVAASRITKLDKNGNRISSFNPSNAIINGEILSIDVDTQTGGIYIGGLFTTIGGISRKHIARLNPDGTLDATFVVGTGLTGTMGQSPAEVVKLQPDGKLLVGGNFTAYNTNFAMNLCRILANGDIDSVFAASIMSGGFNGKILAIDILPNGNILVGGQFTNALSHPRNGIAYLNFNGTINTSFNPGTGTSGILTIKHTPDNKILVGGSFNDFNSINANSIVRLNLDGSYDNTFLSGVGLGTNYFSAKAFGFLIQNDSNIIVVGDFNKYQNISSNYIVRIIGKGGVLQTVPTVNTNAPYFITNYSSGFSGEIIDNGNSLISEYGFCWSTNPNPTKNDFYVLSNNINNGSFKAFSYILSDTTTYYVRAFAENNLGVGYGNQQVLTTFSNANYSCGTVTYNYNNTNQIFQTVKGAYGRCWLNRNIGSSRPAQEINDPDAFGDLFQWGRQADGHQLRFSTTTNMLANNTSPSHNQFITANALPYDWTTTPDNNLWIDIVALNNPCPNGWRVPTEQEFLDEKATWNSQDNIGAIESRLRLPAAGMRSYLGGSIVNTGNNGSYWTSNAFISSNQNVKVLSISNNDAIISNTYRALGSSVRCIKDYTTHVEFNINESFNLYPNPTSDFFFINLFENYTQNSIVEIFDVSGKLILIDKITNDNFQINSSSFANGTYIVKIRNEKTVSSKILIINK